MTITQHYSPSQVAPYINWGYFFHAWQLPFSDHDEGQRDVRRELRADAEELLQLWTAEGRQTHFRLRLLDACSDGEDILFPSLDKRLPLLRQQHPGEDGYCLCLADFVRPRTLCAQDGWDKVGVFVSTVDAELERQFADDDYRHLLAQTLADRLAEATAERGHEQTRREWWGYAPDEKLTPDEMFAERYVGKRPAVGYPSLPDQSLNFLLDDLLDFSAVGVSLTENGAMMPHASTSGLMLSHPMTRHFRVGTIGEDQLIDYARRRGVEPAWISRFL